MRKVGYVLGFESEHPKVLCSVFDTSHLYKDNNRAIYLYTSPQMHPRTKHIELKYHHFQMHIQSGSINILLIDSRDHTAEIFTNPLGPELF